MVNLPDLLIFQCTEEKKTLLQAINRSSSSCSAERRLGITIYISPAGHNRQFAGMNLLSPHQEFSARVLNERLFS
jgi:hypothetical protein